MKILVTYAVQGEFAELKFPGMREGDEVQVGYLRTGIGKVKSAYYLTDAIGRLQPDLVINMGTVGTVGHRVGDIFVCRRFVDRDMEKVKGLGVEHEIDTIEGVSKSTPSFFSTKPRLSQAGALLLPKDFVSLSIKIYTYDKDTFSSIHSQPNGTFSAKNR